MPEKASNDLSDQIAEEMIIRLNGILDTTIAAQISYDAFKALGRIYERKYQKEVQNSLETLNPILKFLDLVFIELGKKQNVMKKSVQNSFMMVFGESTYLDSMNPLDGNLGKALESISKFEPNKTSSIVEYLLNTTQEINQKKIFDTDESSYSDVLYSITAAKRKIEREIDWTVCSINKQMFPVLRSLENQKIHKVSSIANPTLTITMYDQNPNLITFLNNKLKEHSTKKWNSTQSLSLILKKYSKSANTLYLDSKLVPDANDLWKVLHIPKYLPNERINAKNLAKSMNVKQRMASYYLDAAEMLGIIQKINDYYLPTELADKLDKYSEQDRNEIIQQIIQDLPVMKALKLHMEANSITKPTLKDITKFLESCTDLSSTTAVRRASTLLTWLKIEKKFKHDAQIKSDSQQTHILEFLK